MRPRDPPREERRPSGPGELGHSEIATTSSFLAEWIDDGHRQPTIIGPTEVYADLFVTLGKFHQSPTTDVSGEMQGIEDPLESQEVTWRAGRDSNPRPSGSKPAGPKSRKRK